LKFLFEATENVNIITTADACIGLLYIFQQPSCSCTESVCLCLIGTWNTICQCLQVLGRFLLFNLYAVYLLTMADYLEDEVIASSCSKWQI